MQNTSTGIRFASRDAAASRPGQTFLAFRLGDEEYGIDIVQAREIRRYQPVTRIPNALPFVRGVVNLRGVIVPIIDMRLAFAIEPACYDDAAVVIMLSAGSRLIGIVVDSVSDVIALAPDQVRPMPEFSAAARSQHLPAIGAVGDRRLILVDIERLMSDPEMGLAEQLAA